MAGGQGHAGTALQPACTLWVGGLGAVVGGFLRVVGLSAIGLLGRLISATLGAVVLLFLLQKIMG